jgi:hypothetical protein
MIRRSTLILLLIFAVLLGSVFYFNNLESQKEALVVPTEENPLVFHFKGEIKGFSVERTGAGVTELAKEGQDNWKVKSHEVKMSMWLRLNLQSVSFHLCGSHRL